MVQNFLVENENRWQRKVQSLETKLKGKTDGYTKKCMEIEKIKNDETLHFEAKLLKLKCKKEQQFKHVAEMVQKLNKTNKDTCDQNYNIDELKAEFSKKTNALQMQCRLRSRTEITAMMISKKTKS